MTSAIHPIPLIMNLNSIVKVRVATNDDVDKILQVSEGIYGGDYIPVVLPQWLAEEKRFIYLAEYEGEVIGMQVATLKTDQKSFVTQSLRIHPKYRGRKLSYQLTDAVAMEMCTRFPKISNILTCLKPSAAFKMYDNKGYKTVKEFPHYIIHNIKSSDAIFILQESQKWCDLSLVSICKDIAEFLQDKKVLELVGSRSVVLGQYGIPWMLPEEADLLAEEISRNGKFFASQSVDGCFPSSFSYGLYSRRVEIDFWQSYIYANDVDEFKKHFLNNLKAAVSHPSQDGRHLCFICYELQRSNIGIDGYNVILNELSRLQVDLKITSECEVVMTVVVDANRTNIQLKHGKP